MNRDPKPHPPTDHPPAASDLHLLQRRIRVARGLEPADLLLTGGQVVNVFTQRVEPAEIVVADGWIAGVGPQLGPAHCTIALAGRAVLPGLIDPHMHLESTLLTPAELARLIVPHGTTTIISDSHEVGNVLGVFGLDLLLSASRGLPLDLFFMAPACVPATTGEDAGAVLGPPEVRATDPATGPGAGRGDGRPGGPGRRPRDPGEASGGSGPRSRRGWACPGPGWAGPDGLRGRGHPLRP